MRYLILLALLSACSADRLHRRAVVIDTHNDVLSSATLKGLDIGTDLTGRTHSDIDRMFRGGIDAQIFSIFCDERYGKGEAYAYANREIDSLYAIAARHPARLAMVRNPQELQAAVRAGKLACLMGVEGGHMIEDRMDYLEALYRRGARYLTLTWNNSTSWASSAADESKGLPAQKGLNEFGRGVVRRMNELGMIVDVSHIGVQTFNDVMAITKKPVIASHSCAHALCPVPRNLTDDQIRAIGRNGGVIHMNFFSGFLDPGYNARQSAFVKAHQAQYDSLAAKKWADWEIKDWLAQRFRAEAEAIRPPLSLLLDHVDHIVKLIGVAHVGLGSDFDGISSTPRGLDDVTDMPDLTAALLKRGYSKSDVRKILGENFMRVFIANSPQSTVNSPQ